MFTDLSGYTAITERLDPEEVAEVLHEIKQAVAQIVESHGGMANQFVGDAVMALFGLPTAEDNDPRRAVAAALAVHERVRGIGDRVRARLDTPLTMHTGIQTGLVIAQPRDQRDGVYAVTGDAANTASRLLSLADADQILVGPETLQHVAPFFESEPLGSFDLKGKAEALAVHRILHDRSGRTRFDAARDFGLTPWTGRTREMQALDDAYQRALADRGELVCLIGDAGVGKTRISHEFLSRIDRQRVSVFEGRCQAYGKVRPYLPFIQAFRSGLGLREGDSSERIIDVTVGNLRRIDPALERYFPLLLHLLSAPSDEHPMPEQWRGEELPGAIQQAIAAVNIALAKRRPIVLHFEDWHWADEASDAALVHFVRSTAEHPILVLVDHRPYERTRWTGIAPTEIPLDPFDLEDSRALVCRCLRAAEVQDELAVRIHERTLGNPLFVEEICAALEQGHSVERRGDVVLFRGRIAELELPETVQTVIRSRIDKLAPQTRELLRLASVIGREFSSELLYRLAPAGWPARELLQDLEQLEFVQRIPGESAQAYHFRHVTTQEVTYGTLLQKQRSQIHRQVARLIETLHPGDRMEEQLEALADHYIAAGDEERSLHFLERAGAKAAGTFALEQARHHYQRAVERAGVLGSDAAGIRRRVRLVLHWADTCIYSPSLEQIGILEDALRDAESIEDAALAMQVRYWIGWILHSAGDQKRALVAIERALVLAGPAAPDRVSGPLKRLMGQCLLISRENERAARLLSEVAEARREAARLDEQRLGGTYAYTIGQLGLLIAQRGDFEQGSRHFAEALDLVRKLGLRSSESAVLITFGLLKTMQGDWPGAVKVAQESRVIAEHMRAPYHLATCDVLEGYGRFQLGETTIGLESLRRGLVRLDESEANLTKAWSLACLADALSELGRFDEARSVADAVRERAGVGDRLGEDIAARALVRLAAVESAARAREEIARLLELTRDRGGPREQALAALCTAEALAKVGEVEAARDPLALAHELLVDLDMPYYRTRADRLAEAL